jgi:ABC-type sugar transport system substrate-binding protein
MSLKTKFAAAALVALALAGSLAATPAAAKPKFGPALGLGLVAGTTLGLAATSAYAYGDPYFIGYRHCEFVPQYNPFGIYLGTVRVCHRW